MKWLIVGMSVLVGLAAVVFVVGSALPEAHTASSTIRLSQDPEGLWTVVRSFGEYDAWWPVVESVDRLPDHDGREAWRQNQSTGPLTHVRRS